MTNYDLSNYFTYMEMTRSSTAARKGFANVPNERELECLKALCVNFLDPVRERFWPFTVSSGFRNARLNKLVGSKPTSQHRLGQAADFELVDKNNMATFQWIKKNLSFDQLILEHHDMQHNNSGWLHGSWVSKEKNRNIALIYDGNTYKEV